MFRDFQLSTGDTFQDYVSMIIYNPKDGRVKSVSTTVPGFIGSITGMNINGVSIGVYLFPLIKARFKNSFV
jgi:hypothetical protein